MTNRAAHALIPVVVLTSLLGAFGLGRAYFARLSWGGTVRATERVTIVR